MKLLSRSNTKGNINGQTIVVILPQIRQGIPIVVVFRALGLQINHEVVSYVAYDLEDEEIMTMMIDSIEEAVPIQDMNVALDLIGKRGSKVIVTKVLRIKYARDL